MNKPAHVYAEKKWGGLRRERIPRIAFWWSEIATIREREIAKSDSDCFLNADILNSVESGSRATPGSAKIGCVVN